MTAARPAVTGVAHNSEEPRTPISSDKCSEVSKGSQRRLLYYIFCVVFVTHQPARQPIARIEMRNDDGFKALPKSKRDGRSIQTITHRELRGLAGVPARASDTGTGSPFRGVGCWRTRHWPAGGPRGPDQPRVGWRPWVRARHAVDGSQDARMFPRTHPAGSDRGSRGNTGRSVHRAGRDVRA